jgi:hypothetical protein
MIVSTFAPTAYFVPEVIYWPLAYPPAYVNGLARSGGRLATFCNPSPKHSQLAQKKLLMQSQCCLHNIVSERISLSRIDEFSAKFLTRATLRRRERKTDQYMQGQKQNRLHSLNIRLM